MDGRDIVHIVQLFGGVTLIIGGAFWAIRNPREEGEPIAGIRLRMIVLFLLGGLLTGVGLSGIVQP